MPLHGIWRTGTSKIGYPTFHTEGRAVLLQDLHYFDTDVPARTLAVKNYLPESVHPDDILQLRYYYSLQPVFFDEPQKFWQGDFAESYREGKATFEDIIPDLMRENGKYEDRISETIVRTELEKAVEQGIIPPNKDLLNTSLDTT